MEHTINIAIGKGRVFSKVYPLLEAAGLAPVDTELDSRKLVMDSKRPGVKIVIVRNADVATYVTHGVTEIGIVGKDCLMEYEGGGIYEMADLKVAKCRMMVAGHKNPNTTLVRRMRVATKYVQSTCDHFARKGKQVEIIKLYGSIELSPLVGLSDFIVDLVDTGNTLAQNGLIGIEEIAKISTRLIVNKAVMKMKYKEITPIIELLKDAAVNQ